MTKNGYLYANQGSQMKLISSENYNIITSEQQPCGNKIRKIKIKMRTGTGRSEISKRDDNGEHSKQDHMKFTQDLDLDDHNNTNDR